MNRRDADSSIDHHTAATPSPRERVFSPEEWDEWAVQVEDIIVREVGILSHVEGRVVDPIVNLIELAYGRGSGAYN